MRLEGPIPEATVLLDGTVNGAVFTQYIKELLAPQLSPGEIVVMDNLCSHKADRVREAIEARGTRSTGA